MSLPSRLRALSSDLKLFWAVVFCLMYGFGVYSATFFNFVTEVIRIRPEQLGVLEAVRETPGFLCVIVTAITMRIAEPLLGSVALFLVAVGMGAYATVHGVPGLIVWSFIWSVGLHTWMPLSSSIVLTLAKEGDKGKRLGQTSAVGSLGATAGMMTVRIIGYSLPYPKWFLLGGGAVGVAFVLILRLRRDIGHAQKPRLVWKREYSLYYALTFLEGCRKQVFFTFAPFALTKVYKTPLETMALLMVINNVVNFVGSPIAGRWVDRIGERRILITSYTALALVFLGYASIPVALALCVLYCLDNLFYLSTICLTTYLQKIAEPADLMPSLSLGVSLNHTAAVVVPLVGGYLWAAFSYPVTFYGGTFVVLISLYLASQVRSKRVV